MNVVLVGPPGAGKGTQAERLMADFRVPRISAEALRHGVEPGASDSSMGAAESDDPEALRVGKWLCAPACARGFILDGFPRTLAQAEALERTLAARGQKLQVVVSLEVPEEVLFERLSGRRVCPRDGRTFNVFSAPPIFPDICDECAAPLRAQAGGCPEQVERRIVDYLREAALLRRFYESRGLWCPVDGEGTEELVYGELLRALADHLSGTPSAAANDSPSRVILLPGWRHSSSSR